MDKFAMKRMVAVVALCVCTPFLASCAGSLAQQIIDRDAIQADRDMMMQRSEINQKLMGNPDTDAWYDQRQKISQAIGDRVFEKNFQRVFDSLTLAVAALEIKVNNMERTSGFISASGITLPPADSKALRREAVDDWLRLNNYDPSILTRDYQSVNFKQMGTINRGTNMSDMMAKFEKMQRGLTFQLAKMGDNQTKVKLRFSDVNYPGELEAFYKTVWQAVDKQIFVDQTIEGKVERRK